MKKKSQLLICLGVLFLATSCSNSVNPYNVSDEMVQNSIDLLSQRSDEATDYIYRYNDLLNQYTSYVDPSREITLLPDFTNNISIQPSTDIQGKDKSEIAVLAPSGGEARYTLPSGSQALPTGIYTIEVEYFLSESFKSNGIVSIYVGNSLQFAQASSLELPILYEDDVELYEDGTKNFDAYTNKYGDQMAPKSKRYGTWHTVALNTNLYDTADPALFEIFSTTGNISIRNNSSDIIYVSKLTVVPYVPLQDYTSYFSSVDHNYGTGTYKINALNMHIKIANLFV